MFRWTLELKLYYIIFVRKSTLYIIFTKREHMPRNMTKMYTLNFWIYLTPHKPGPCFLMACVSFCGMTWSERLLFVLLVLVELLTIIVWRNWKFEDTKGVIRDRKLKTDRQHNVQRKDKWQRDKHWSTEHHTEN